MALPTTDPRIIPTITAGNLGGTFNGYVYNQGVSGSGYSFFVKPYVVDPSVPGGKEYGSRVYLAFSSSEFYMVGTVYWLQTFTVPAVVGIYQPLMYNALTAPAIIYAYARWKALIPVTNIDTASFTAADAWCLGNNYLFSPSFIGESSLEIMRKLCEASFMVFIYVNGSGKIGCGYIYDEPSSPDWTLEEGDWISVKSYCESQERKKPATVRYGWDARHILPGSPKFGWAIADIPYQHGERMTEPYDSKWVDHGPNWPGSFCDFRNYMRLEIEMGPRAFLLDLGEAVQITHAALGLSIDPDYPDYFRVHKIRYHLATMTATVTLLKSKWWNIA